MGADDWRDLERRFRELQPKDEDGLRAEYFSRSFDEPLWNGSQWALRDSPSESVLNRFITAALEGARLAGCIAARQPWLDLLKREGVTLASKAAYLPLLETWLDLLKRENQGYCRAPAELIYDEKTDDESERGWIPRICEWSANYCARRDVELSEPRQVSLPDAVKQEVLSRGGGTTVPTQEDAPGAIVKNLASKEEIEALLTADEKDGIIEGGLRHAEPLGILGFVSLTLKKGGELRASLHTVLDTVFGARWEGADKDRDYSEKLRLISRFEEHYLKPATRVPWYTRVAPSKDAIYREQRRLGDEEGRRPEREPQDGPQQASTPKRESPYMLFDPGGMEIWLLGKAYDLTGCAVKTIGYLLTHPGEWQSNKTIDEGDRADKILDNMPEPFRSLIQRGRKGYRIPREVADQIKILRRAE